jgi:hypothetical protein
MHGDGLHHACCDCRRTEECLLAEPRSIGQALQVK